MLITIIRVFIIYFFVIFSIRMMGKRQIGELEPTELVITLLMSEIASVPLQDNSYPLINSVIAVLLLVSLEIINSVITLKSSKMKSFIQGNSFIVIKDGQIDYKTLNKLRFSKEELIEQLRQKDIFDLSELKYAIIETNGSISVLLKKEKQPLTEEKLLEILKEKNL